MKSEVYHLRIGEDESRVLKELGERCGLSATVIASALLKAAVAAVKDHRGRLLPPRFTLADEPLVIPSARLNEPTKTSYTRK